MAISLSEYRKTLKEPVMKTSNPISLWEARKELETAPPKLPFNKTIEDLNSPNKGSFAGELIKNVGLGIGKDLMQQGDALAYNLTRGTDFMNEISANTQGKLINDLKAQGKDIPQALQGNYDYNKKIVDMGKNTPITSSLTKYLQDEQVKSTQKLKEGKKPITNTLTDITLAGANLGSKLLTQNLTGMPLPIQYGMSAYADTLQEDLNKGIDDKKANLHAMGSGVITGSVESLMGIGQSQASKVLASKAGQKLLSLVPKNIANYLSKASNSVVGGIIKNAFGEGLEEAIEYDAQRLYQNLVLDENTPRDIKEQAYSALIGGVVGGLFGGGKASVESKTNTDIVQDTIKPIQEIKPKIDDLSIVNKDLGVNNQELIQEPLKTDIEPINNIALKTNNTLVSKFKKDFGIKDNAIDLKFEEIGNSIKSGEININAINDIKNIIADTETTDTEFYDTYKPVKNEIRNTRFRISDELRNMGNFNEFRKNNFGNIRLSKDGVDVDTWYQEMSNRYSDLFPTDIINQQDQLIQISKVANDIKKTSTTFAQKYGIDGIDSHVDNAVLEYINSLSDNEPKIKENSLENIDNGIINQNQQNEPLKPNSEPYKDLGADTYNPEAYSNKLNEYGAIEPGEIPDRIIDIPKSIDGEKKVRRFTRTAMESENAIDDSMIETMEQMISKGDFNYVPSSNKNTIAETNHTIEIQGYDESLKKFKADRLSDKKITEKDIAMGERLIQLSKQKGDTQTTYELIIDVAQMGTDLGKALQAIRILKRLSPEGQLKVLDKQVQKINAENIKPQDKKTLQEITKLQSDVDALTKEVETTKTKYDDLVAIRDLETQLKNEEDNQAQLKKEFDTLRLLRDNLEKELKKVVTNEKRTTTNLYKVKTDIAELRANFNNIQLSYNNAKTMLENSIIQRDYLKKTLSNLQTKTKTYIRNEYKNWWDIAMLSKEIDIAKKEMDQAQLKYNLIATKSEKIKQLKKLVQDNQIKIDEDLVAQLLNSTDQEMTDEIIDKIKQDIANQIPSSWVDKWNAWRYLSMLGNPRTHIRNIVGNAVFTPVRNIKNIVGTVLEQATLRNRLDRTKAVLTPADGNLKEYAELDFNEYSEAITGEGKYSAGRQIQNMKPIFKNKVLEKIRNFNFDMLESEDRLFLKSAYINSFAQAMKAKGATSEYLNSGTPEAQQVLNDIRSYATIEAQKATYRDASEIVSAINSFKNKNKATKLIGEGLVPFTKTPVNIIKRGIEYSPIGLVNGLKSAIIDVKKGDVSPSQAIDQISSGLTGTGIVAMGVWLASLGLITGGRDEDKKQQAFEDMQGVQNYALKIGDMTYTIDWASPTVMPLFVGVELFNSLEKGGTNANDIINSLTKVTEPVFELSMLQGINNAIKTAGYSQQPIIDIVTNSASSYIGQGVPTIFGQVARTIDDTRRSIYVDKNSQVPAPIQRTLQNAQAKLPYFNQKLQPRLDNWGRESKKISLKDYALSAIENFVSPGYFENINTTKVDKGLQNLYDKTGENVLPTTAQKYIRYDGETKNLTAKEYTEFKRTKGELSYKLIDEVIKNKAFNSLSDLDKVNLVRNAYDYAQAIAKSKVSDYKLDGEFAKIREAEKQGINVSDYLLYKASLVDDYKQADLIKALNKTKFTNQQKSFLFSQRYAKSDKNNPYK